MLRDGIPRKPALLHIRHRTRRLRFLLPTRPPSSLVGRVQPEAEIEQTLILLLHLGNLAILRLGIGDIHILW